ncbi:hypothetical protein RI367_004109 [Sorochytrium milnesiophthora]
MTMPDAVCFVLDSLLCVVIILVHVHNIKSLSAWLSSVYIFSFLCGGFGALASFLESLCFLGFLPLDLLKDTLDTCVDSSLVLQMYLQAIVIIQRVHIVNAYEIGGDAITVAELLRKRWPELVCTAVTGAMMAIEGTDSTLIVKVTAGVLWLASIIILDVVLSLVTFNKVHRMLNTRMNAFTWAWHALQTTNVSTFLSARPSTMRLDMVRSSPKRTGSSSVATAPREHVGGREDLSGCIVRAWLILTFSIVSAAFVYFIGYTFCSYNESLITFHLAWASAMFGSIWQRGSMLYIEAIKHVAMSNRTSKQYLGTMTKTGIAFNTMSTPATRSTQLSASERDPSPRQSQSLDLPSPP